jgi:SAM-dependent MidA family methyltransferase
VDPVQLDDRHVISVPDVRAQRGKWWHVRPRDARAGRVYNARVTPPGDDFESITESAPLIAELAGRIAEGGPMTFRDYMGAVLYHPRFGYYATHPGATSRGGDYVTSPEVHPVFGAMVAKQLHECWNVMSCPTEFRIVEQGAGAGLLARDILRWATTRDPRFAAAIRYTMVEPIAVLRAAQERAMNELSLPTGAVEWRDALPDRIEGVVVSNELLDAFPVHRVVRADDDRLHEVYVALEGGRFADELGPLSTPALRQYFDDLSLLPGIGCVAEVNLEAPAWMRTVAAALHRGYVLTFDYGYEAKDLYAPWRRDGTLLCCYRQSASSGPYQRIGKQDITASVDFTTLQAVGENAGLTTLGFTNQSDFLVRLGVSDGIAAIAQERPDEMEEYFARRSVVMALIDPARLGRIRVLLQGKSVATAPLRAFGGAE